MRTNLITHFHCTNCGSQLQVECERNDLPEPKKASCQTDIEPTGAECRYNLIYVEPCQICISKVLAPARKMADAIKEMIQ